MASNIKDLLQVFDSYDESSDIEKVYYTRKDGIKITLQIESDLSKLVVIVNDDRLACSTCFHFYYQAIRVLDVKKKLIEIIGGTHKEPYERTYLNLEGSESLFE